MSPVRQSRTVAALALLVGFLGCEEEGSSPSLIATCSASPVSGAAPLAVAFTLNVAGSSSFDVTINYGDGTSSGSLNLAHVYPAPGGYTATFSVSAEGRSAACSTAVNVTGPAPVPTPGPGVPSPSPSPAGNQPPNAVFKTTPNPGPGDIFTGTAPLAILFNMCASQDVDIDVLLWTMDFEGDRHVDIRGSTGAFCRRSHTYAAGTYRPEICVTDVDNAGNVRHDFQCKRYTVQLTP
jgi:hypothetical protein